MNSLEFIQKDIIEIMINYKADEVLEKLFSLFSRYQIGLETPMRGTFLSMQKKIIIKD